MTAYLDALVPAAPDPRNLIERLRTLGIRDGGDRVDPGPLDEATLNLVRRLITTTGRNVSLELPRGRQDVAVMLGIYLQLMRRGAQMQHLCGHEGFSGPVVVVGLNVNLTERLRRIKIGAESLSEALQAQRVRSDGTVTDLHGTISPAQAWGDGLLYLNTSLGWPTLPGVRPGIVVIDRTTFRNSETLDRALNWCAAHGAARIIVLNNLGEPPPQSLSDSSRWLRWGWTPGLRRNVIRELGNADCCGPLSTNPLLAVAPRRIGVALYRAPTLARLRRICLVGIVAARKVNEPFPKPVADAVQLVNLLGGLWGNVTSANVWAVADPRAASVASLTRSVRDTHSIDFRGPWATFQETQWPDLRYHALQLADLLGEDNPRLDVLTALLDWAAATRPDARVVVRTRSRPAAGALLHDLSNLCPKFADAVADGDPATARVSVLPYSERLPWATGPALELHLGVPAPWRCSALLSAEACEHVVVVDTDEQQWLSTVVKAIDDEWAAAIAASAQAVGLVVSPVRHVAAPHTVFGPLDIDSRGTENDTSAIAPSPSLDLPRLFAEFSAAIAQVDRGDEDNESDVRSPAGRRPTLARPITLEPGDTVYWLSSDGHVEVLAGTKYSSMSVADLTPGISLLLPRGETRDELYTRLLQATHRDTDVMAVTLLLRRFRRATQELHDQYGTWEDVARRLRQFGSKVQSGSTCRTWATGEVIAPDDVDDIRRVARLIYDDSLIADHTWQRIGVIAVELRRLHRELGRLLSSAIAEAASGQPGANLRRLSQLCGGIDTAEILEEFEVRRIRSVGPATSVPSSQLGQLLPIPADLGRPA